MNRSITGNETESVVKNWQVNRSQGQDIFTGEFCQTFKEEFTSILLKLFRKNKEEGMLQN